MGKIRNQDKTLTPFDQVAREYSVRNPHDPITASRAQQIGIKALWKIRKKLKTYMEAQDGK